MTVTWTRGPVCTCMGHWTVRPGWKAVGVDLRGSPILEAPLGTPLPAYVWTVDIGDPACVIHAEAVPS